jgi:endonuclease/exonuclease/phosphatase family metal-dependent hydrolase
MSSLFGPTFNYTMPTPVAPAPAASDTKAAKAAIREIRQDARALKGAGKRPEAPAMSVSTIGGYTTAYSMSNALRNLLAQMGSFLAGLLPQTEPVKPTKPPKNPPAQPTPSHGDTDFTVSSFNILGSNHTAPGGINAHYASGVERTRWAVQVLRDKKIDLVGFQEMAPDQAREFKKVAGNEYALFPGDIKRHLGSHNSIAWRKDEWDLVKAEIHEFPGHKGRQQPTPLVRLRNKETGQEIYVLNIHNAPGYHNGGTQQKSRDAAVTKQIALVNELKAKTGLPVIVTGDQNDKEIAFRRMTGEAGMKAANSPNGRMPKHMSLDWIFGSKAVDFSGFARLTKGIVGRITDHGVIVSKAHIDG